MHSESGPPTSPEARTQGRILLADDDDALRRVYRRVLEEAGFSVDATSDGEQALQILNQHAFDAVVTDIVMPKLGGLDLLKAIRACDVDVPVVLMTAMPELEGAISALENGALAYLRKPFDHSALRSVVTRAVRLNRLARLKREAVTLVGDELMKFGDRASLDAALDRALASLWMAYQPIVSVSRREVIAYEALMRTAEPALPHPGAILRAAERVGRLEQLGRTIRGRVAAQMNQCPAAAVYVNLHGQDLLDDELFAADSPLTAFASRVVLEITERASLAAVRGCEARRDLRRLGFRLAIDDLGAGYAGLTSFAQLEPDVVKFDMSLVRGIEQSPVRRRLVASMTSLFAEMRTVVVAEGVETESERDTLVSLGCDNLQGYLFARPDRDFPAPCWPVT